MSDKSKRTLLVFDPRKMTPKQMADAMAALRESERERLGLDQSKDKPNQQ